VKFLVALPMVWRFLAFVVYDPFTLWRHHDCSAAIEKFQAQQRAAKTLESEAPPAELRLPGAGGHLPARRLSLATMRRLAVSGDL
jgi:hypothetical protein